MRRASIPTLHVALYNEGVSFMWSLHRAGWPWPGWLIIHGSTVKGWRPWAMWAMRRVWKLASATKATEDGS